MTAAGSLCSQLARQRGDELSGTAVPGTRWILIEYRRPWPLRGFAELPIDPDVKAAVSRAAAVTNARILLIRRYGRHRARRAPLWAVLEFDPSGDHRAAWGTWSYESDLREIATTTPTKVSGRTEHGGPLFLVCTQGVRDTCCAVWGRAVAKSLDEHWPESTWECSHVGGDRFAGNVVVVPDGVYYGQLDGASAVHAIRGHLKDRIEPTYLRGYVDLSTAQQYAVGELLRRYGSAGRFEWRVTVAEQVAPAEWEVIATRAGGAPSQVRVRLREEREIPARLTCRAMRPSSAMTYAVESVTETR